MECEQQPGDLRACSEACQGSHGTDKPLDDSDEDSQVENVPLSLSDITDSDTNDASNKINTDKKGEQYLLTEPAGSKVAWNEPAVCSRDSPSALHKRAFDMDNLLDRPDGQSCRPAHDELTHNGISGQSAMLSKVQEVPNSFGQQSLMNFEELINDSDDSEIIEEIIEDDDDELMSIPKPSVVASTDGKLAPSTMNPEECNVELSTSTRTDATKIPEGQPTCTSLTENSREDSFEEMSVELEKGSSTEEQSNAPSVLELNSTSIEEITDDTNTDFEENRQSSQTDEDVLDSELPTEMEEIADSQLAGLTDSQLTGIADGVEEITEGVEEIADISATVEQIESLQETGEAETALLLTGEESGENLPLSCLLGQEQPPDIDAAFGDEEWAHPEPSTAGPHPEKTGDPCMSSTDAESSGVSIPKKSDVKKKRKKKRKAADALGSDKEGSTPKKAKKLRKLKKDGGDGKAEGKSKDGGEKKKKKKKKKEEAVEEEGDKKSAVKKTAFERRNIRKIKADTELDADTKLAQQEEMERKRRLEEREKLLAQQLELQQKKLQELRELREKEAKERQEQEAQEKREKERLEQEARQREHEQQEKEKEQLKQQQNRNQHLMSLLEDNDEDAGPSDEEPSLLREKLLQKDEKSIKQKTSPPPKEDVVEISSSDEDVVMLDSDREEEEEEEEEPEEEEEEEEAEDPNNSGSHVNDAMNLPDAEGRVLVNVGHPPDEPDIFLAPQLSRAVKPHQIGGIRFLYDNLVESLARYKQSQGFGCILAHSMGLGKTLQVIAFTDIFLRHTGARTVMIIVPVNTLANWVAEFNMWLPSPDDPRAKDKTAEEFLPRDMNVNIVTDNMKTVAARAKVVEKWHKEGGVLLLGYEMYRLLTSKRTLNLRPKKSKKKKNPNDEPEVIDLEEEDRNKELMNVMHDALTKPGPDLVICDEGHRIKNSHASISRALKSIRTKRRVVLTGYPLQNNLLEYWCMVDFVRPNFLGNKTEFCNMFERPIMNGQCMDSTPQDVRLMRFRAHVLHSLLEGFVQRRGHTVLRQALPEKNEYVLLVRMSPIQKALYARFMEVLQDPNFDAWENNNPIKAFSVCCKMWNHPDILHQIVATKKIKEDNDLDIDYKTTETDTKKKKVPTATLR